MGRKSKCLNKGVFAYRITFWTRLSFLAHLKNMSIVTFTNILKQTIYLSTRQYFMKILFSICSETAFVTHHLRVLPITFIQVLQSCSNIRQSHNGKEEKICYMRRSPINIKEAPLRETVEIGKVLKLYQMNF